MFKLYTEEEYHLCKADHTLLLQCYYCQNPFKRKKKHITHEIKNNKGECKYCSHSCYNNFKNKKQEVACLECNSSFQKSSVEIERFPNHFCTRSCAVTYNNKNKTYGTRRSKLEVHLEEQLTLLYPEINFHFNRKDTINSELDIYIPSLKLAFELNGIFHYEPIYGQDKLDQIHNNDKRKFQACLEYGIKLYIIDTSTFSHFKEQKAKKHLDIVTNIINLKLSNS